MRGGMVPILSLGEEPVVSLAEAIEHVLGDLVVLAQERFTLAFRHGLEPVERFVHLLRVELQLLGAVVGPLLRPKAVEMLLLNAKAGNALSTARRNVLRRGLPLQDLLLLEGGNSGDELLDGVVSVAHQLGERRIKLVLIEHVCSFDSLCTQIAHALF